VRPKHTTKMRKTHDKFFVVRFPPWLPSPPSSLLAGPLVGDSGSPAAGGGTRVVRESGSVEIFTIMPVSKVCFTTLSSRKRDSLQCHY
jgi:hypothetical protein